MVSEVGQRLRQWRTTRRMSQLELSAQAGVSARHLSFVETGRSRPTREMILRLAGELDVPLGDAHLAAVLSSLRAVLTAHAPYPALLIDRHWTMIDANDAVGPLTAGCAAWLLEPPVNVLRLSLHPAGMAPRIGNLAEWRTHVLHRLDRQAAATADPVLRELHTELAGYPGGRSATRPDGLVVPLRFDGLAFFSITSVLGTPLDVTLSELAIESFLPADAATAAAMREMAGSAHGSRAR
jgi:transcriptional regulator with XRE-family HTH domain